MGKIAWIRICEDHREGESCIEKSHRFLFKIPYIIPDIRENVDPQNHECLLINKNHHFEKFLLEIANQKCSAWKCSFFFLYKNLYLIFSKSLGIWQKKNNIQMSL